MKNNEEQIPSLSEIEAEVMAEGREWMRRRLQEKLQQLSDQHGEVFPPKPKPTQTSASAKISPPHRRRRR